MPSIKLNTGIRINYQDKGERSSPVIILIMGLGAQMNIWPDELYLGLVNKGYRVIRFDNRDVGKSSQLDEYKSPSLFKAWLSSRLPIKAKIPYKLEDMALDVLALMTALKIKKAHLVGASMGGMIAQIIAAKHKKRVLSLTSIMSSISQPRVSKSNLHIMLKLAKRPAKLNQEAAVNYNMKLNRLIGSPAYPVDEGRLRKQAQTSVNRGYNPAGIKRQLVAITASGSRQQLIKKIKAPTLVIHGSHDPVIPISAGLETANQIRKAKLKIVNGMGHDFPPVLMTKWIKWISKHVEKAEKKLKDRKLKNEEFLSENAVNSSER